MPVKIFFCYAHEDEQLLNKLKAHLTPLQRQGLIDVWHDRDISAGSEWEREISHHLDTAQIILLLISPDFMVSDYCYSVEMKRAMERKERGEAHVIPIILDYVYWQIIPLNKLQALPTDAKPILSAGWHNLNEALFNVVEGILKLVKEILLYEDKPNYQVESDEDSVALEKRVKDQFEELEKLRTEDSHNFLEAADLYNQANEAYRDGDNARAIENYLRALELQPNSLHILERLGRAYSNLNEPEQAIKYFEKALSIDPSDSDTLRSLALLFRNIDQEKALKYLNRSLKNNAQDFVALDFLGLFYRDQGLIDEAIAAHEEALKLKKRPETEFYLSMLYAQKGDYSRGRLLALSAVKDLYQSEHDLRIRSVWKTLIRCGLLIFDGSKAEALNLARMLAQEIPTQRIYDGITSHIQFLLAATEHKDWIPEFMNILNPPYHYQI